MANRICRFFKTGSFAILLFHVGVLLFSWPLLSLPVEAGGSAVFSYLLIAWTVIVCLVAGAGVCIRVAADRESEE